MTWYRCSGGGWILLVGRWVLHTRCSCYKFYINIEKMKHDMKWDARRFAVQIILALAAAVAAGVALGKLLFGA